MKLKDIWRKIRQAIKNWLMMEDPYEQPPQAAEPAPATPPIETVDETPAAPAAAEDPASDDEVDFGSLHWSCGGFKGGSASLGSSRIGRLAVSANGLSYAWRSGGCEEFGATAKDDASHALACLFVRNSDGTTWSGGKFDWISTSRLSRDFKNIRGGYKGWPKDAADGSGPYAFVIVGSDGRKRTNVITVSK